MTGCTATGGNVAVPGGTAEACAADQYLRLIAMTPETARDDLLASLQASDDPDLRVIGPADAVTMDFRIDRVNIEFDEAGSFGRVYCG